MNANVQTALRKFLESQRKNSQTLLDCSERLYAIEYTLTYLDSRSAALLKEQKDRVHDENQKLREHIDSLFQVLEALVVGFSNPPN